MDSMQFSSERELQNYCLRVLRSKGIPVEEEVNNGNVRADIVTDKAIIECKKVLTRDTIFQAYGQALVYQKDIGRKEIWIVGISPKDIQDKHSAENTAREVEKNPNVTVSFIDEDEYWREEIPRQFESWRIVLAFIGLALLLLSMQLGTRRICEPIQSTQSALESAQ
jgi:hypothetical protein